MSVQQSITSFDDIHELFRQTALEFQKYQEENRRKSEEADRRSKEADRKLEQYIKEGARLRKELHKKISALGSRIGDIVENMIGGNIVGKFRVFGYEITQHSRRSVFKNNKLGISGQVDMFLEDGEVAILIEVKTTLETADVRQHIERLQKYRRYADAKGDKRRFIGAVAGAVAEEEAMNFAHENGMYVIIQSGDAVEIITPPEGFVAKEW